MEEDNWINNMRYLSRYYVLDRKETRLSELQRENRKKLIKASRKASRRFRKNVKSVGGNVIQVIDTSVHLIIRRKKTTLHLDAPGNTSVLELKKMIEVENVNTRSFYSYLESTASRSTIIFGEKKDDDTPEYVELDDSNALSNCKLDSATARSIIHATLGLAFRQENGLFESLEMTPYSEPEPLPVPTDDAVENYINVLHEKEDRLVAEKDNIKSSTN